MSVRVEAESWILEALNTHGGEATIPQICKYIWDNYEELLRSSGDGFYIWQYEVRWAAMNLRKKGNLKAADRERRGIWQIQKL